MKPNMGYNWTHLVKTTVDVWFFFDFSCETPSRSDWGVNFIKDDDLPLTMLFV
ncbi:hypothetical protein [Streptococcus merionis]|uniref:hypothetical protein n=1 Tax=Streptococcus merionis TaxID=400065 RepID=UPI00039C2EDA|nr:hypothetical protein [Streptococcus merionis]